MKTRINEESDYNVILSAMNELTSGYDSKGNPRPRYFDIDELASNFGITYEEVIDIAENNGYNVYRVPGGDELVTRTLVASEDLSYGDVVKDFESDVDIDKLGKETDDSFNMEEDYMDDVKPFNKRQVYDELKRETQNFTKEDTFSYSFESEWEIAREILMKHYEDVEFWDDDTNFGTRYFVDFKTPRKGKKKVKETIKEDVSHPLVGKKVNFKGENLTIEDVDEEDDEVFFKLSNGKQISVKICVEKGFITSEDDEVNALLNRFKVEEPEEQPEKEPEKRVDSKEEIINQALNDAREDWYEYRKNSPMYKTVKAAKEKNDYSKVPTADPVLYATTYFKEFNRLRESVEGRLARAYAGIIEKTYSRTGGDVDGLIAWLREAVNNITVTSGDVMMKSVEDKVKFFNDRDGTNATISHQDNKQWSSWNAFLTDKEEILSRMPVEVYDWRVDKNSGTTIDEYEVGLVYNERQNKIASNPIVLDLLYEYGFKLGKQHAEDEKTKDEGLINDKYGTVELEYDDLEIDGYDGTSSLRHFTYDADRNEVAGALAILTEEEDDYIEEHFEDLVEKYYDDLKDTFEESASEAATDAYNEDPEMFAYEPEPLPLEDSLKESNSNIFYRFTCKDAFGDDVGGLFNSVWKYIYSAEDYDEEDCELEDVIDDLMNAHEVHGEWLGEDVRFAFSKEFVDKHIQEFNKVDELLKEGDWSLVKQEIDKNKVDVVYEDENQIAYKINESLNESINSFDDLVKQCYHEYLDKLANRGGSEEDIDDMGEVIEWMAYDIKDNYEKDLRRVTDIDWHLDDNEGFDELQKHIEAHLPVKESLEEDIENNTHKYLERLRSAKSKQELDSIKKEIMKDDSLSVEDSDKLFKVCHELLVDLKEDIEKHDELNPKLFDGEELKPEIKDKIEQIAYQFVRELNEDDIRFTLKDIVLLGSNVSYNYTKDSDLDIHLIADSSGLECPDDLYPLLYSAYRSMFNKNYDIRIKGIPAEIYVEMDEPVAKSNGIYSLNNGWIKKPEQKDIPDLDTEAFDKLFTEWEDKYFDLEEKDATSEEVENFIEDLYDLRKESIANEGEYGLGNLVFKEFRNIGYLDNLKELRKECVGKELSLESIDKSTDKDYNDLEVKNMHKKNKKDAVKEESIHTQESVNSNGDEFDLFSYGLDHLDEFPELKSFGE